MKSLLYTLLVTLTLFVTGFCGEIETYEIDNDYSYIGMSARHMAISKLNMRFNKFSGYIKLDNANIINSSGKITIEVKSLDTGNKQLDALLTSEKFLNANTYPHITFVTTGMKTNGDELMVHGQLTICGVARDLQFDVPLELIHNTIDNEGKTRLGLAIESAFRINRQDFGIKNSETLKSGRLIFDNIFKVDFYFEGVKK